MPLKCKKGIRTLSMNCHQTEHDLSATRLSPPLSQPYFHQQIVAQSVLPIRPPMFTMGECQQILGEQIAAQLMNLRFKIL